MKCPDCHSDAEDLGDGTWLCRECGAGTQTKKYYYKNKLPMLQTYGDSLWAKFLRAVGYTN